MTEQWIPIRDTVSYRAEYALLFGTTWVLLGTSAHQSVCEGMVAQFLEKDPKGSARVVKVETRESICG